MFRLRECLQSRSLGGTSQTVCCIDQCAALHTCGKAGAALRCTWNDNSRGMGLGWAEDCGVELSAKERRGEEARRQMAGGGVLLQVDKDSPCAPKCFFGLGMRCLSFAVVMHVGPTDSQADRSVSSHGKEQKAVDQLGL